MQVAAAIRARTSAGGRQINRLGYFHQLDGRIGSIQITGRRNDDDS
jgi:hypothetical protein